MDGKVLLIADDMYVGANTVTELLCYWEELLAALSKNNLVLSASKTIIAPALYLRATSILNLRYIKHHLTYF